MSPSGASLENLTPSSFVDETVGLPTILDIVAELRKPGRDPRPEFRTATFSEGVEKISDLRPGMVLDGVVTNVAAFGAFVDVGVHQDGLVHISAMSSTFISDPHDVVKSGQVVKVKVLEADPERKRISLTLRLDDDAAAVSRGPRAPRERVTKTRAESPTGDRGRGKGSAPQRTGKAGTPAPRDSRRPPVPAQAQGPMAEALRRAGLV